MTTPRKTPPEKVPTPSSQAHSDVHTLLTQAHEFFQHKNRRDCAHTLALAETTAKHHHLHREAAQFRQALTILAQGGTPKLLARPLPKPPL
jgi:hypothetical protein